MKRSFTVPSYCLSTLHENRYQLITLTNQGDETLKMDNSDGKINKPLLKIAFLFPLRPALLVIRQSSFPVRHSLFITRHSLHLHHLQILAQPTDFPNTSNNLRNDSHPPQLTAVFGWRRCPSHEGSACETGSRWAIRRDSARCLR